MSFLSIFRRMARRSLTRWVVSAYRRGGRECGLSTLDARIAARVAREKANGTYDYVEPVKVRLPKRAAVKRNGGLRGSTATRWSR